MADRSEPSRDDTRARAPAEGEALHQPTPAHESDGRPQILGPGTPAPSFRLPSTPDQKVALEDFLGRPMILVFYPADWSPVCGDELAVYNELLPEFHRLGAELAGISVDGPWCHVAFAKHRHLHFPLLADFEPKGDVARAYGAYRAEDGIAERALFLVDANGIIRWSYLSPVGVNPGAEGILNALEALSRGEELAV